MKAWFNEKGNWCFEFEKEEKEAQRISILVAQGERFWRDQRDKYPESFISAALFRRALETIFIGQNYSQEQPTIEKPIVVNAEEMVKNLISVYEKTGWSSAMFNEKDMQLLKNTDDVKKLL